MCGRPLEFGGRGPEGDSEDLILVVVLKRKQFRPGGCVAVKLCPGFQLGNFLFLDQYKIMLH